MNKIGFICIVLAVVFLLMKRTENLKQKIKLWQEVGELLNYMEKKMNYHMFSLWSALLQYTEENPQTLFCLKREEPIPPHKAIKSLLEEKGIESEEKVRIVNMIRELEERTEADVISKIREEITEAKKKERYFIGKLLTEKKTIRPIILAWTALAIILLL